MWNLAEPGSRFRAAAPNFIGRTPSFSSCWGKKNEVERKSQVKISVEIRVQEDLWTWNFFRAKRQPYSTDKRSES